MINTFDASGSEWVYRSDQSIVVLSFVQDLQYVLALFPENDKTDSGKVQFKGYALWSV
jgi:hypothetical protein